VTPLSSTTSLRVEGLPIVATTLEVIHDLADEVDRLRQRGER